MGELGRQRKRRFCAQLRRHGTLGFAKVKGALTNWPQCKVVCRVPKQKCQPACKPGSVWRFVSARWPFLWDGRCRPPRATNPGESPETGLGALPPPSPLFGLAPGGACRAADVTARAVRSYRTLSPLPAALRPHGGLLSVALSLRSPSPDVIRHRVSMEPGLSSAFAATIRPAGESGLGALTRPVNLHAKGRASRASSEQACLIALDGPAHVAARGTESQRQILHTEAQVRLRLQQPRR
ncbi:MAG: hypothetical protein QOH98_352 [Methylobacteriaceae bacterium]|nr:hypothetical protein [Methylobacteriaceae bacterium]